MKYFAIFFSLFIIAIIILADRNAFPPYIRAIYDFPNGDKVGHFILFGLLNFFIIRAFLSSPRTADPKRVALSVSLILALLIGAEEWSQRYFSVRTVDLVDLTASYLGLIVGSWIALRIKK